MNTYSGVPDNFTAYLESMQTRALEREIREAIKHLNDGQQGKFDEVIGLLAALIGEGENQ